MIYETSESLVLVSTTGLYSETWTYLGHLQLSCFLMCLYFRGPDYEIRCSIISLFTITVFLIYLPFSPNRPCPFQRALSKFGFHQYGCQSEYCAVHRPPATLPIDGHHLQTLPNRHETHHQAGERTHVRSSGNSLH